MLHCRPAYSWQRFQSYVAVQAPTTALFCSTPFPTCRPPTGDIFLLDERDIIHTNLSVREGLGEDCPGCWELNAHCTVSGSCASNFDCVLDRPTLACTVLTLCPTTGCCCVRVNVSVCAEIVVSVGMALPPSMTAILRRM